MKRHPHPIPQGKNTNVEDHPETVMPPRLNAINDITTPPDPGQSPQGPQAPSANANY